MSEKRLSDDKPWEPAIEKLPTFNPFANNQNQADHPEFVPDPDELEDSLADGFAPTDRK